MREADAAAVVDELVAAWNEHDMRRFAACFAEDADFVNVAGMWWHGRAEIEQRHAAGHAGRLRETTLESRVARFKEIGADIGVAHATWELTGPNETRHGVWSFTLRAGEDRAEIVSAHNTNTLD